MARRSQCSSAGDNPLDPNYLPPHYREEYRLAIDALVEEDLEGYYKFLQKANVVDFLSTPEIQYIQSFTHIPHQSYHPEQKLQETEGDGSSDTYWPLQSDQDVPGLDLGWPQLHRFIGPTEVTTLVNPPEPDMPSIKEQARRLIKNAQQVIAIVMDMFTDVDIFADVLDAATRSVAVYILLDEQNTDYFLNMVSNCRVNLQSIQFLRVRTVSGITYHCRSGKSFKGQMMDRFLLTDCRAVLSGNYSFMWSFEKLHRCMAHLFLGQLVSTFDEEFRILFAQSQPLMFENTMEDFGPLQKRQYPSERTSLYREPRKFLPPDSEERIRHSYDERMDVDWRMMHLKRQEPQQSPADIYSRFPSQQPRMDSSYDQGPFRMSLLENPAFKRHSYAEGAQGRYSYPHLQPQGMPEPEIQGRQFHRGQKPFHGPIQGPEADYTSYDKFWSQDYLSDQYSESGLPQDIQPPDNFDPVLNYLSSTRNVDFDQSSDKIVPEPDLPFSSSHPRGLGIGSYACQNSPTSSNTTEQKLFFQESNTDRKDPTVKQGLRNWRISSYLSTYDNPGDEGLPLAPTQAPEPFEEPSNPLQQTAPGIDFSFPKIPNVREFKVPAIPRASQMPCYTKNTVQEKPKKLPDELTAVAPEVKTTPTPTPSESSSTTEGEKVEEAEQKEPKESKTTTLLREESFRRKFSAAPRGSRLRSSLIFSSLDQQHASQDTKTAQGQQDEENDKNDAEQTKMPFVSHVLGQRRFTAREPFEWSRYIKSSTFDNSTTETSKPNDGNSKAANREQSKVENSKDLSNSSTVDKVEESLKRLDVEQANSSPSIQPSKPSESKLPRTDQPVQAPISLLTTPSYVDMSDPGKRLMFFKELAAQRKAAEAAEAQKSKDKAQVKLRDMKTSTTLKKEETDTKRTLEKMANISQSEGLSEKHVTTDDAGKNRILPDSGKKELETCQPTLPVSAETGPPQCEPLKDLKLSKPAFKGSDLSHPLASTNTLLPNVLSPEQGINRGEIPKQHSLVKNDVSTSQSCKEEETIMPAVLEKKELETSHPTKSFPSSAKTESPSYEVLKDLELSKPAVKESSLTHPPTSINTIPTNIPSPQQGPLGSEISKQHGLVKNDVSIAQRCKEILTKMSTDSEKELENNQPTSLSVAAETEPLQPEPLKDLMLSKSAVNKSSLSHPPATTNATAANIPYPEKDSNESQIPNQDSLVKNDSEKKLETNQPTSLSVATETEPPQTEHFKDLMLSKPAVKRSSLTHPLPLTNATPANVPSPEQSSNKSDIPNLDCLVKNDTSTSQSCKEQHTKMSTDSGELEIIQSPTSVPISAETEHPQYEPFKDLKMSPAVKESSLTHPSTSTNTATPDVPPPEKGPNGSQIPKQFGLDKNDASTSQSCKEEQAKISTDPEKEPETSQPTTSLPVAAETESSQTETLKDLMLSKPAVTESSLSHSPPSTNATSANVPSPDQGLNESDIPNLDSLVKNDSENKVEISQPTTSFLISAEREPHPHETLKDFKLSKPVVNDKCISPTSTTPAKVTSPEQGPDESEILNCDSTLKGSSSLILTSPEEQLSAASAPLDSNNQKAESAEFQPVITEELSGSEWTYSNTSIQSSTPNLIPTHPGSQIIPSLPNSCSAPHSSPEDTLLSNVTTEDSSSTLASSIFSPSSDKIEPLELVSFSPHESSQTAGETWNELTESESTQVCLQSVAQLTSSEIPSVVDSAKVVSDITPDTCTTEPSTVSLQSITKTNSSESFALTPSEYKVLESGNNIAPNAVLKESEGLRSSEDVKSDIKPQDLNPTSPNSNFPNVSNLELSTSRPDQIETSNIHLPYKHSPSETGFPANLDITANASQSTANASPQDAQKQATLLSEFNLTQIVSPAPAETVSCSYPLTESDGSHFSPDAKKAETNMSTSCIPSDTPFLPKQITEDLNQTPSLPSTETSSPNEPTSKVPTEPDPTPEYVTSESHAPEPSDPAEKGEKDHLSKTRKNPELSDSGDKKPEDTNNKINVTKEESVTSEKTNVQVKASKFSDKAAIVSNQVMSPSSQSKQPKASQSRYQSSTANVLSSSNLRDDTKLLLEQISANSQSRNEATKASPVTDDEKEDKAEKTEKIGTLGRRQPKSSQDREKLLERIQSMRKERKVYSRFEMAP